MAHWDDKAIETLKKLYVTEGLSAGQCAARMPGFSRNAIIGKVHRMNLGGRKTLVRTPHPRRSKPRPQHQKPNQFLQFQPKRSPVAEIFAKPEPTWFEPDLVIPEKERKTVQTLGEKDCRWPIGDPQHVDFHFCGKTKVGGLPYCEFHARRAYQPPDARRRPHAPQSAPGGPGQSQAPVATPEASSQPAAKIKETV